MTKSKIDKSLTSDAARILSQCLAWIKAHKVQIIVFFGGLAVLFFRRPDAILNAQFWAEDALWFSDAVNGGYSPLNLFEPYAGYLTLIQRFIALISGLFPLALSPLIFNLGAMSVQVLVLVYLWSSRTDFISKEMKVFLSFIYLCLPYTQEVHANLTNAQWYLGLLLFLIVFMKEPRNKVVKAFDWFFVLLGSLSGPFSIFLMPILLFDAWRKKKIPRIYYIVAFGAVVQLLCLVFTREKYGETNIGYSVTTLLQIVGGQVFGAGLFGVQAIDFFFMKPWIAPVTAVLGAQLMILVFIKSTMIMRYFIAFGSMIFGAALLSTLGTPPGMTWWYYFTTEAFGGRYYIMLHLAVYAALGWLVLTKVKLHLLLRAAAVGILALSFAIGVPNDFEHEPYKDFEYKKHIEAYEQLPPGKSMAIPVNPGEFWHAGLTKR